MEDNQKIDSGFNLDVTAGKDESSASVDVSESLPSSFVFSTPDVKSPDSYSFQFTENGKLPQPTAYVPQPSIQLPEQTIFESTQEKIQPQVQPSQASLIGTNISVKVEPEEVLRKTNEVDKGLQAVRKDVEGIYSQMRNPDGRLNQHDSFEERVTIPAANVIFENRKIKMTKYPDWI